jgi:uncharacterized membrane protein YsdA (DUF1294 family)
LYEFNASPRSHVRRRSRHLILVSLGLAAAAVWKEIWKGGLQAIGALLVAALVSRAAALIPSVRGWMTDHVDTFIGVGRVAPTVFFALLSLCFLVLFITSRVTLYRLRRRIVENRLTLGDMAGGKRGLDKALDEFDDKLRRHH